MQVQDAGLSLGHYFTADIHLVQDYYPYGMTMPGRTVPLVGGGLEYRYGFNGKETDTETDLQDYGFRIYNPRIGKFLSVDPLAPEYPWYTPYQFAGNKPIRFIDRDGLEEGKHGFDWDYSVHQNYDPLQDPRYWTMLADYAGDAMNSIFSFGATLGLNTYWLFGQKAAAIRRFAEYNPQHSVPVLGTLSDEEVLENHTVRFAKGKGYYVDYRNGNLAEGIQFVGNALTLSGFKVKGGSETALMFAKMLPRGKVFKELMDKYQADLVAIRELKVELRHQKQQFEHLGEMHTQFNDELYKSKHPDSWENESAAIWESMADKLEKIKELNGKIDMLGRRAQNNKNTLRYSHVATDQDFKNAQPIDPNE